MSGNKSILSLAIADASSEAIVDSALTLEERAALAIDVAWVGWRADFRRKVVASGVLKRPWRSVFEADMIFSIVAHRWLTGRPITHKELATHFVEFATETTISRHIDDMEHAGMLVRRTDEADKRRMFLLPTGRLETVGREFLRSRIRLMREQGFVWTGASGDSRKTASDIA